VCVVEACHTRKGYKCGVLRHSRLSSDVRLNIWSRPEDYEEISLKFSRFLRVLIILNIHNFSLCQIPDLGVTNKKFINHRFISILENINFLFNKGCA